MQLKTRIHEWLADQFTWVQYPEIQPARTRRQEHRTLLYRWSVMTRREHGWALFWIFWSLVVALSIFGNLID